MAFAASTIDGSCNYILEGEPKKRFDWSIFWDLLIRWRAWRGLPKQSKSKLSYTPIEWIVIIISMNAVWIKRTIRFHSEGVVWKEAWMYVVVCLVSVLLFRGYRYPFLPPSQIGIIVLCSTAFCLETCMQVVPPPMLLLWAHSTSICGKRCQEDGQWNPSFSTGYCHFDSWNLCELIRYLVLGPKPLHRDLLPPFHYLVPSSKYISTYFHTNCMYFYI